MVLPTTVGNSFRSEEHCINSCTSCASRLVFRVTRFPSTICSNSGLKHSSTACCVMTTEPGSRPEEDPRITVTQGDKAAQWDTGATNRIHRQSQVLRPPAYAQSHSSLLLLRAFSEWEFVQHHCWKQREAEKSNPTRDSAAFNPMFLFSEILPLTSTLPTR